MSRTPPPVSVRRTAEFDADLEVLRRSGISASDAVRHAVHLIAQAHRMADQLTQASGGRRPRALTIHTTALYPRPYDGPDQGV
ncbi:hypothetical protein ACIQ8G_03745 [Streptomyces sp. NPDC094154]|uniref:hypothetical protein n=1 Tax=Streptomyces sp. NPDC094154 TaxID=3366059 RepID=UPI003825C9B3